MLFDEIFTNPKWAGQDKFPSSLEWKNEVNKWLIYIKSKGQLDRYIPRLNSRRTERDEALAEIKTAYFLEVINNIPIIDWERTTQDTQNVDIVLKLDHQVYCEIKSPGWESELTNNELSNGRTKRPKHISGEARSIAPWYNIRYTIKKAYSKFSPETQNVLIIADDLFTGLLDWPDQMLGITLYEQDGIYQGEKGYFTGSSYENIGGILAFDCIFTDKIIYRNKFYSNKYALKPVALLLNH